MRRQLAVVSILVGLVWAQPQAVDARAAKSGAEQQVRATLEQLYSAWGDLDPAKAAPFYAKDPSLTFFDVAPMKYTGWAEYVAGVPSAFSPYRSGKFTLNDDLRAHVRGNLAWATATWHGELNRKDGGNERVDGRYTAVLEKRGDRWLVIHEHMSVPMGAVPTK